MEKLCYAIFTGKNATWHRIKARQMKAIRQQDNETAAMNGLNESAWSVISFERCEASGLTYAQAVEKMIELDCQNVAGLCIVTDEAAARIKTA